MNVISPISNIVIDAGEHCPFSELLSLINELIIQLDGIGFIMKSDFNLDIYFNFSCLIDTSKANLTLLLQCIATHLKHPILSQINIIIRPNLLNESILSFISEKKFRLKVLLAFNTYKKMQFNPNQKNQFIDVIFKVSNKTDLKDVYKSLSIYEFFSLDFILPNEINLSFFIEKLISLTHYYLTANLNLSISCINKLIENYLKLKFAKSIVSHNASLLILINGDLLKAENYLCSDNKNFFLKKWNIYKERLINIFITHEYYQYFLNSSLSRLDIYVSDAIIAFNNENEYRCKEKVSYFLPFYKHYAKYIDDVIQNN